MLMQIIYIIAYLLYFTINYSYYISCIKFIIHYITYKYSIFFYYYIIIYNK